MKTLVDLYAFGSRTKGPRLPRPGSDLFPDDDDMIGPESPPSANGASTFADVNECPLSGHYHVLPAGSELPEGLEVVYDGIDIDPDSVHLPTHHTIFPNRRMRLEEFMVMYQRLPWSYVGKKP